MSIADKAGMLFHDIVVPGPGGTLAVEGNHVRRPPTESVIRDLRMTHLNLVGEITDIRQHVAWFNRMQEVALDTPLGIPITLSTDPRHSFSSNPGAAAVAGVLSRWPEPLGLAALRDPDLVREFGDTVRREYLALGLRTALHPQADLATEPRWARIGMTFGEDAELASALVVAYLEGLHGPEFGPESISTVVKHFPGGGPQKDGEDPHFDYGREQVYPAGRFDYHLEPFRTAIDAGVRQVMPYYGLPIGTPYEEVAFGFNRSILAELLRGELGFDGIILSDFGIISDATILGLFMAARAWGVEHLSERERVLIALDAGVDQFGGERRTDLVIELLESGRLSEERVDASVRRLRAVKFALGLFDEPFLDVEPALDEVGRAEDMARGHAAQARAVTILKTPGAEARTARLGGGVRVYVEGIETEQGGLLGEIVTSPQEAEVAVLRLAAPFEPRPGGFEKHFHAGSLSYPASVLGHVLEVCGTVPTIVVIYLDRPAVLPEIAGAAEMLAVDFGATDAAIIDVLLGRISPEGRLPVDLPSSMAAVELSAPDAPFDTADPLFRFGDGLAALQHPREL
jgi:beta-glucosidase